MKYNKYIVKFANGTESKVLATNAKAAVHTVVGKNTTVDYISAKLKTPVIEWYVKPENKDAFTVTTIKK